MNPKIWLSSPHMGQNEIKYVQEAFDTNWISPLGPNVNKFEEDLSVHLSQGKNKIHAAVLNSGTAAIHLGLSILGVGPGDYVLCQSFTFCGSANPVVYLGATPVFIDSELDTWNMCPSALNEAIEGLLAQNISIERIKAIIPVHLYGMPCKIGEIHNIASKYGIPVLEDAAEALGSTYNGIPCGAFGEMAALSFNGNKIITTSGGGALVSANEDYVKRAKFLSTQARDEAPHYQHTVIGYNYRMSNVVAGIGRGQMEVLSDRVAARRANNKRYRDYFDRKPGIRFQTEPDSNYFSNFWLSCILIDPKATNGTTGEQVRLALANANIEARPLWKPMHLQPIFSSSLFFGKGHCEDLFESGLCLPSGSNLTDVEFDRIFSVLDTVFGDEKVLRN